MSPESSGSNVATRARFRSGWWMVLWMGLGILVSQWGRQYADEARYRGGQSSDRVALHPPTLQLVSMGQPTLLADLIWIRTVLAFADIHDDPTPEGVAWVGSMVNSVAELDEIWRTAFFYGGSFLRVLGDIDGSDAVFEAGHKAFPDDSFFPFSLGMNAYLHRQDNEAAFRWVSIAANCPNAPNWYRTAAAGFVEEGGDRRTALRYLEEQMQIDQKPRVLAALRLRYNALLHDELVDQIAKHRQRYIRRFGQDIERVAELGRLPDDPLEGEWILAPDGVIRSSEREASLARQAVYSERSMILLPVNQRPY